MRTLAGRTLLVLLSLGVTLAALEGLARLIPLWPDQLSDVDPRLGISHIPGAKGWWVNVAAPLEFRTWVEINSQGLRDREFPQEKAEGELRILVLGDSYVDALQVPLEDTFVEQLEGRLRQRFGQVEVINGGHYGYGTDQELLFYRQVGSRFEPDIVVLAFMPGNDILNNLSVFSVAYKPYFTLNAEGQLELNNYPVPFPPQTAETGGSLYTRLKRLLFEESKLYRFATFQIRTRMPGLRRVLVSVGVMQDFGEPNQEPLLTDYADDPGPYRSPPDDYYEGGWSLTDALVRRFAEELDEASTKFIVVVMPDPRQFGPGAGAPGWDVTVWNERLEGLCAQAGIFCLDLYPVFRGLVGEQGLEAYFFPLDGHPNRAGHQHIAQALYAYLTGQASELLGDLQ